jgi:hypothetical protein
MNVGINAKYPIDPESIYSTGTAGGILVFFIILGCVISLVSG